MRRVLLALLSLMACQVAKVDDTVLYRCATDGSCPGAASFCWADGFCRASTEPGRDAGGPDAGGPDACVPIRSCTDKCGTLPDGCGGMVTCGGCNTVLGEACGGGGVANVCGLTEICSDDGFCWKNPLPQGNALTSVWALSANQAWAVGDASTALEWDGARWFRVPVTAEADLSMVTGNATDVFACGGPYLYRLENGKFVPELTVAGESFVSISAGAGDSVWAGTELGSLYQRSGMAPSLWVRLTAQVGTPVTGLFAVDNITAFAATPSGVYRLHLTGSVRELTGAFIAIGGLAGPALHAINEDDAGTRMWGRQMDGGWQPEPLLLSDTLPDGGPDLLDAGTVTPFPLTCIGKSAVDELWAAGDKGQEFRFDGTAWLEVHRFDLRARSIASVAGAQSKLFGVGELGTMWASTAGVLRQTSRGHNQNLRTISVGPNTIWVAGSNNSTLRNDPPNPDWTDVTVNVGTITGIAQTMDGVVFAGSRQQIGNVGGTSPGVMMLGTEVLDFTAMAGPPPLVVVGQRGLSYAQNSQGVFLRLESPDAGDFRNVRKFPPGAWAVTAHSFLALGTDGGWQFIATEPVETLEDVEFTARDGGPNFFLPTQSAVVLSYNSSGRTELDSGVQTGHHAALMDPRGLELFLVGDQGAITVKSLGGQFTSLRSGTHFNLQALGMDGDGGLWVVGDQGTTLFRR